MDAKYTSNVLKLPLNASGRDFVVGDVHGHFELFEILLKEIKFDPSSDRILSVGDSIDRGPESARALEYFEAPWFYSVKGNHEEMLLLARQHEYGMYELWMHNGGEWSDEVSEELLKQMAEHYESLPLAIQVETEQGIVGILHADIPPKRSWSNLLNALEEDKLNHREKQMLLWSRESYKKLRMSQEYPGTVKEDAIEGVYRIYVGHSIVKRPSLYGNMMFMDTGAYTTGRLSAVDLNNEEVIMVQADKE